MGRRGGGEWRPRLVAGVCLWVHTAKTANALSRQASEADGDGSDASRLIHFTGFAVVNGNRMRVSATVRSDSLMGRVAISAAPLPATDVRAHALDELSSVM